MASPVDTARTATNIATAATPWTANLPASIAAGELLILFARAAGAQTFTTPGGWTPLITNDATDATDDVTAVFYRWADGSEGTTLSLTLSAIAKGATIAYRITGAENPATQPPQSGLAIFGVGANADSPSISPTGGSKDYLFLTLAGIDQEVGSYSLPTGYSNLVAGNSGTGGAASTNVMIAGASRQATTATENPPNFGHSSAATGGTAITVAIHPAGAAAPTFIPRIIIS